VNHSKKKIIAIIGSATEDSSNLKIAEQIAVTFENFDMQIIKDLHRYPHFETKFAFQNIPDEILQIREQMNSADGILFCTPEYIFSIPSGLKNILEWCVSTVIFTDKPVSIITASASGKKGHEELNMILKMLGAITSDNNNVLLNGIKSRFDEKGQIDEQTLAQIINTIKNFEATVDAAIHKRVNTI